MKCPCAHCGRPVKQTTGSINRARKFGKPIFCDKRCSGLAHRNGKTKAQKAAEKKIYDAQYRAKNLMLLKAKKAAYFQRTYDPKEAAVYRKKRMHLHIAYCRRPEYRKYKVAYDRDYKAKKDFGDFWECAILAQSIETEVLSRITRYEIYSQNGTLNKSLKRKREYEKIIGRESKAGIVGNPELNKNRQNAGSTRRRDSITGA